MAASTKAGEMVHQGQGTGDEKGDERNGEAGRNARPPLFQQPGGGSAMPSYSLEREQVVARPLAEVFDFFSRAENLEALTPNFLRFSILTPPPIEMKAGAVIEYRLSLYGIPVRWKTLIEVWEEERRFVDLQVKGPYRTWRHEHRFEAAGGSTVMRDRVDYSLPMGPLGGLAHALFVRRSVRRIFDSKFIN
jgi:ligand-binding SRPBCC domain-containing protein